MSRLILVFPRKLDEILKKISREQAISKLEVIRRALVLYHYIRQEYKKYHGQINIQIRDKKTDEIEQTVVF